MNWAVVILFIVMSIFTSELVDSVRNRRKFDLADQYVTAPFLGIIFLAALLSGLLLLGRLGESSTPLEPTWQPPCHHSHL